MRGLFVAGTDTNVGKTFVSVALCRSLFTRGVAVVGLKPYETGCAPTPKDADALERATHSGLPLSQRCPVRYQAALAPAVAAEREGRRGGFAQALAAVRAAAVGRVVIVEAAGGLWVPLDARHTNLDLAAAIGLPVLLVGRDSLGTLNHLALSVEALRHRAIGIAALVLSRGAAPNDGSQLDNLRWAKRLTGVKTVIGLPRCSVDHAQSLLAPLLRRIG